MPRSRGGARQRCARRTRRFALSHGRRHPDGTGADEVTRFLSHPAIEGTVCASTQNQAPSALLFLCRDVLGREPSWLDEIVRARRPSRLPVVLAREGKSGKDRVTLLPSGLCVPLQAHLARVGDRHGRDPERGLGSVELPMLRERKYPGPTAGWAGLHIQIDERGLEWPS